MKLAGKVSSDGKHYDGCGIINVFFSHNVVENCVSKQVDLSTASLQRTTEELSAIAWMTRDASSLLVPLESCSLPTRQYVNTRLFTECWPPLCTSSANSSRRPSHSESLARRGVQRFRDGQQQKQRRAAPPLRFVEGHHARKANFPRTPRSLPHWLHLNP